MTQTMASPPPPGGASAEEQRGEAGGGAGASGISIQLPGRSYYKHKGTYGQSLSLTQSHFDIRDSSARLAKLEAEYDSTSDHSGQDLSDDASFRDYGEENIVNASKESPSSATLEPGTPSGLSVLMAQQGRPLAQAATPESKLNGSSTASSATVGQSASGLDGSPGDESSGSDTVGQPTPQASSSPVTTRRDTLQTPSKSDLEAQLASPNLGPPSSSYTERSPLLRSRKQQPQQSTQLPSYTSFPASLPSHHREEPVIAESRLAAARRNATDLVSKTARSLRKQSPVELIVAPVKTLPAVILGILMNLLDGVSYGMIMFPVSSPVFASFGGIGVSMFFASCFVSQLVFSSRSIFKGGNGSMMIEVVPFLHVIAFTISNRMGGMDNQHAVIATTMVAYALTAILTGLTFFLLGYLRLGAFIEFFPRIVLVGCIGGVGAFLVITGVEVCAGLENETLELSWTVIRRFFETQLLILWSIPLLLAAVIRTVTFSRFDHPLVFPAFMLAIPIVFYIVVLAARIPMSTLREQGWIFNMSGVDAPWYEYFRLYDLGATDVAAILETIPTQLALVFFALLHVPINVPALALSVGEDNVETDKELVNHGLSNFLAGCAGTIPNYLVYTNSVLFYRVGGDNRLSSFMLSLATLVVFLIGPWVIGYLPVMIVGTLIYILGFDLLKEAVWDTWGRVSGFEYTTIWIIVLAMTYFDFVVGIGVGIVVACVSFVIVSSQRQPIRSILTGATASSTVRRHPRQSAFLRHVGSQTRIIKLQSFLFFGTIVKVEARIRELLDSAAWDAAPIRFLIIDFSMASGLDFSAAEAFLRIQRLLQVKNVVLVLCGCNPETPVGRALSNVDLFGYDESLVRVFSTLNDALEHCENSQLRSLYSKTLEPSLPAQQNEPIRIGLDASYRLAAAEAAPAVVQEFSPRRTHLYNAASETLIGSLRRSSGPSFHPDLGSRASAASPSPGPTGASVRGTPTKIQLAEPVKLLLQSLGPYAQELREDFFYRLVPYLTKVTLQQGQVLWKRGDVADAVYVLESGILRATYEFPDASDRIISESMLPGTIAGEMTFLAGSKRNATVVAERDCQAWKLSANSLAELEEKEGPKVARALRQVLLRVSAESSDVLMGHLIAG